MRNRFNQPQGRAGRQLRVGIEGDRVPDTILQPAFMKDVSHSFRKERVQIFQFPALPLSSNPALLRRRPGPGAMKQNETFAVLPVELRDAVTGLRQNFGVNRAYTVIRVDKIREQGKREMVLPVRKKANLELLDLPA